jgi:RNA polymerase sigma factor (sigma-70 family)
MMIERTYTMIAGRPSEILRQLEERGTPDRELLARFVRERDQAAFAELVRSHGPVVLGVCRRVTGHPQDAEDAFQAVFLILARKATTIRNPDVLGSWLYSVAVQVARKARRSATRRRQREVVVSPMPDPPTTSVEMVPELSPILDEELAALPSWYRDAIILCDLRGASREEAAAALGVPEGTVSSRLASGRKKLAARLTKRGIALSTAAIPTTLSATQAAVLPAELLAKTCGLVADWMAGGAIPRPLIKLTEGGMTMRKMLMLGALTTAAAVAGVVYAAQPAPNSIAADPHKSAAVSGKSEVAEQPVSDAKPGDKPGAFTSTPKLQDTLDISLANPTTVLWNSTGTQLAIEGSDAIGVISFDPHRTTPLNRPLNPPSLVGFTPDGKKVLTELREYNLLSGLHRLEFWVERQQFATLASVRTVNLDPTETQGYAFAADGKTYRTLAIERQASTFIVNRIQVLEVDAVTGKRLKSLLTVNASTYALSSDGKRLAVMETKDSEDRVVVFDVDRATKLFSYALPAEWKAPNQPKAGMQTFSGAGRSSSLTFSPDGRRLIVYDGIGIIDNESGAIGGEHIRAGGAIGQTLVLNADTGKALPALEGVDVGQCIDIHPSPQAFTADSRLLVLSGSRYDVVKQKLKTKDPMEAEQIQMRLESQRQFLTVWDMQTGKVLKTWDRSANIPFPQVAFNPVRPVLAILEPNRGGTRIGLWDFSTEVAEKK